MAGAEMSHLTGALAKLRAWFANPITYQLPVGDHPVALNSYLGERIKLCYQGEIRCVYCRRKTNKSFNQGYCYPCFIKLAQCDRCIVSPETCHYHQGTCREPDWGERHCMRRHIVYLANSSGLKVGITRADNIPARWIDQGAIQALPIISVDSRYQSGLCEVLFKEFVADRTNWRKMLQGKNEPIDMLEARDRLMAKVQTGLRALQKEYGLQAIQPCGGSQVTEIRYPVITYPGKITSLNLDKTPVIEGRLLGLKGQYLILDCGVLNIRKFAGYQVTFTGHP